MKKIIFLFFFVMTSSYAMAQAIVPELTQNFKSETTVNFLLITQLINNQ